MWLVVKPQVRGKVLEMADGLAFHEVNGPLYAPRIKVKFQGQARFALEHAVGMGVAVARFLDQVLQDRPAARLVQALQQLLRQRMEAGRSPGRKGFLEQSGFSGASRT